MQIVQTFKNGVSWYQPGNDHDTWLQFFNQCFNQDYSIQNTEFLKQVAYNCLGISSGADAGMWQDRASRLDQFLTNNIGVSGDDIVSSDILQYEFVSCFLNPYNRAAHNNDLWQSFNDSAVSVLKQDASIQTVNASNLLLPSGKWLLTAIPLILLNAIKTLNFSTYKPTEDADTWAYFQNVVFDLNLMSNCSITYHTAYLVRNISSGPDQGVWSGFATGAQAFLQANLGNLPADAASQQKLAINFCNLFKFNWQHAAHNQDMFKTYNDTFTTAVTQLQALKPT